MLLVSSTISYAEIVGRLSVHWSPKHHSAKHAQIFADEVNKRANGKLKIEVYPSKQLFGIREVMGAVTSGAVELGGIVGVVSFPPINKNFNVIFFVLEEYFDKETNNIWKKPRKKPITQSKLGKALNVTFQQIQKYESGHNGLSSIKLLEVCNFFNKFNPLFIIKSKIIHEQIRKC